MGVRRAGFTLLELMVVLVIVTLVSAVTLPGIVTLVSERAIQHGGQIVQAACAAARDDALRTDEPRGIRFLPDPAIPGMSSRLVSLLPAPDYSEGLITMTDPGTLPPGFVLPYPCLMVEQAGPLEITSWPGNIRVGDRIRITSTGPWYTVVGPTDPSNPTDEGFVAPVQILDRGAGRLDYLWLANGIDDDGNGFIDDGWDGLDNNNDGMIDDAAEWEVERWRQPPAAAVPYLIRRRPVPGRNAVLPAGVVVGTDGLRDILFQPLGGVSLSGGPYAVPSSLGLSSHEIRIPLIERGKTTPELVVIVNARTGQVATDAP